MEKREVLVELKKEYQSEKSKREKMALAVIIVLYVIQTNRIIRILGDLFIMIAALFVIVQTSIMMDDFLAGLGIYAIVIAIWSLIRGDADSDIFNIKVCCVYLVICMLIAYCIGRITSEMVFVAIYFTGNILLTLLKEIFLLH